MRRLLIALTCLGASGCSLVVGSLDECQTNADCAAKGPGLICQDSLCVKGEATDAGPTVLRDPLCQSVFGAVDGGDGLVRLAAIVPKTTPTGEPDQRGVLREHAIQLAVEQLNAATALPGHPVVIRVCDDTGDNDKAAAEAKELLDEGAVALVSTGSSQTLKIAAQAAVEGVPVMSISATSTQIAAIGVVPDGGAKLVWSTAASDELEGKVLAGLLSGSLSTAPAGAPFAKPAVIERSDVAFDDLYVSTQNALQLPDGGQQQLTASSYTDVSQIPTAVQEVAASSPDAVVVITPVAETPALIQAWSGPDPVWIFTDNGRSTSVYAFDGGLERLAGTRGAGPSAASASDAVYTLFAGPYRTEFGVDPATTSYVPNAYDAVLLLGAGALWADLHGGITGPGIARGLSQLSDTTQDAGYLTASDFSFFSQSFQRDEPVNIRGASGALDFDPATGVAPGPIDVWTIAPDGGIVTLQTVTP